MPSINKTSPSKSTALEYTLTNDVLFKMLFRDYPDLLKHLVAELLKIPFDSIGSFTVKNPEMPPDSMLEKFCRLDIVMEVDGRLIDLEVQVEDEKNYPERCLYHWARLFSSGLPVGDNYSTLPRTIVISILAFSLFKCAGFHSEFKALEVKRHEELTDKMVLHFFELPKLPKVTNGSDGLKLWLALFNAKTEEELSNLITVGGTIMSQAVSAYRSVSASGEFKELERLRLRARLDEANALSNARREEREKWQGVVAEKDATLAEKDATLAEKDKTHAATLAEVNAVIAEQAAVIEKLMAQISRDKP